MSLNGLNPLAIAIQNGHLTIVQYMLDFCEVDVNKTLNDLISPLHLAAAIGHLELVQCLLSHKADMDKARFDGATPLFMAAAGGFPTVVDYLLQKGAKGPMFTKLHVTTTKVVSHCLILPFKMVNLVGYVKRNTCRSSKV